MTETQDWRYRYSAAGEREQKRLYLWLDSLHNPVGGKSWVYYALGGSREQLAVYHGQEQLLPACSPLFSVYFYPTEYLTYGIGSISSLTTLPDAVKPKGVKEFKLSDQLGSTRVVIPSGAAQYYDYTPWGGLLTGTEPRKSFIDKEKDRESGLSDFGVRKYDPDEENGGRFQSIDPKWEKFAGETPYNYADNNPLVKKDPNGDCPLCIAAALEALYYVGVAVIATVATVTTYHAVKQLSTVRSEATPPGHSDGHAKPGTYVPFPPEKLPADVHGNAIPSSPYPHTQLGVHESKKRGDVYPQAREWGADGKPKKRIDFSDHDRPKDHPNPHEHPVDPASGKYLPAQPLNSGGGPRGNPLPITPAD